MRKESQPHVHRIDPNRWMLQVDIRLNTLRAQLAAEPHRGPCPPPRRLCLGQGEGRLFSSVVEPFNSLIKQFIIDDTN